MKKLEGEWQLVTWVNNGNRSQESTVKLVQYFIRSGKLTYHFQHEQIEQESSWMVDPSKDPKTFVQTYSVRDRYLGIYKLKGDTLTICQGKLNGNRPTTFEAKAGSGYVLRVFKRVAP